MEDPLFWDNPQEAQKTIQKNNELKAWIEPYRSLHRRIDDLNAICPDLQKEFDADFFQELVQELQRIQKDLTEFEIKKMFSHELDGKNCYFSIRAGAGGTESCDWVAMLARMYSRWFEIKNWKVEQVDEQPGDVAGIKSITLAVSGPFAFGYCKAEKGVHRLVRISPFDSNAKRHTSFAAVDVIPEIDEDIAVEIRPEDLRIDTYRSSGAGGQHVNTTDSAVRITHIPTNIVVTCQKERSQIQNRETCMKMLRSKLYELELEKQKETLEKMSANKKQMGWASQIRNYVFHPYSLIKDVRTNYQEGNIQKVMDGDLDPFVLAYLKEFG